jgi:hypothetical protein
LQNRLSNSVGGVKLVHAALLHRGKYYKYSYPKAYETYGGGLNDKGMIAGGYVPTKSGVFQAFK